eukprot:IDg2275t1
MLSFHSVPALACWMSALIDAPLELRVAVGSGARLYCVSDIPF